MYVNLFFPLFCSYPSVHPISSLAGITNFKSQALLCSYSYTQVHSLLLFFSLNASSLSSPAGITNFDLLGDFGKISWLGSFWIVLGYNALFASAAAWCLVKKFTATIRHEIYMR